MSTRRYMDITGNIRTVQEKVQEEEKVQLEDCKDSKVIAEKRLEQDLANIHQDDEEIELKESTCPRDTANLLECSLFTPLEETDPELKDVVECAICGRFDWKSKDSLL